MSARGKSLTRARVNALLTAAARGLDEIRFEAESDGADEEREFLEFEEKVREAYTILRHRYPETRLVED